MSHPGRSTDDYERLTGRSRAIAHVSTSILTSLMLAATEARTVAKTGDCARAAATTVAG